MENERKICVGMIAGAHGIRGLVRLKSFTEDPYAIASYGALTDATGEKTFALKLQDVMKDHFTASITGVSDRDTAEDLRGTRLYAVRAQLPKTKKREYYAGDLLGLPAQDANGKAYGTVMDVHDHGAGVFLEIGKSRRDSFMLPFTDAYVPDVDIGDGIVTIVVPEGWLNKEKPPKHTPPEAEA